MSAPAAFTLRIEQAKRKEEFDEEFQEKSEFSESVPTFDHSSTTTLVCLIQAKPDWITHIGNGHPAKGRNSGGSRRRRLRIDAIRELSTPISCGQVVAALVPNVQRFAKSAFQDGGLIKDKTFENVIDVVRGLSPEAAAILSPFSSERRARINALAPNVRSVLAAQKDSVAVALIIAGIDRDELRRWDPLPIDGRQPRSFLDGLESVRLRELPMIVQDLRSFPGCDEVWFGPHSSTVFEGRSCRLTVIMTDRQPLEEVTGTDLIYFNETYRSFVMVQYKAMSDDSEPVFRFAHDKNLPSEIQRMQQVRAQLSNIKDSLAKEDFRLNQNPFFLKICPRLVLNPDDTEMIKGMYIPLDLWTRIEADESMAGPKGGPLISFENVGRYMTNSDFAALVSKGWIGTNQNQSAQLETFVRDTLSTGRSLTFAVQERKA